MNTGEYSAKELEDYIEMLTLEETLKRNSEFITVFPNPFSSTLYLLLKYNQAEELDIELFNTVGVSVLHVKRTMGSNRLIPVELNDLPTGLFYLKISNKENSIVEKVVKK